MADGYTKEVIRILQEHGCFFKRNGRGDHAIWHSPLTGISFPVDQKIKSRHTANGIMKQAGINHKF